MPSKLLEHATEIHGRTTEIIERLRAKPAPSVTCANCADLQATLEILRDLAVILISAEHAAADVLKSMKAMKAESKNAG